MNDTFIAPPPEKEDTDKQQKLRQALELKKEGTFTSLKEAMDILSTLGTYEGANTYYEQCINDAENIYNENYTELYEKIKAVKAEMYSFEQDNISEIEEKKEYEAYLKEQNEKKPTEQTALITVISLFVCLFTVGYLCYYVFQTQGVSLKTILGVIAFRIVPGVPLSVIITLIANRFSKVFFKRKQKNDLEETEAATLRVKELNTKLDASLTRYSQLKNELDALTEKLKKLNSLYDEFCG